MSTLPTKTTVEQGPSVSRCEQQAFILINEHYIWALFLGHTGKDASGNNIRLAIIYKQFDGSADKCKSVFLVQYIVK